MFIFQFYKFRTQAPVTGQCGNKNYSALETKWSQFSLVWSWMVWMLYWHSTMRAVFCPLFCIYSLFYKRAATLFQMGELSNLCAWLGKVSNSILLSLWSNSCASLRSCLLFPSLWKLIIHQTLTFLGLWNFVLLLIINFYHNVFYLIQNKVYFLRNISDFSIKLIESCSCLVNF